MLKSGLLRFFDQFEELVAVFALAVVVLSVSWGVITRYITAQPAAWASEIATLGFAWVVFFGAAACIKYKLHPAIDLLNTRLPPRYTGVIPTPLLPGDPWSASSFSTARGGRSRA